MTVTAYRKTTDLSYPHTAELRQFGANGTVTAMPIIMVPTGGRAVWVDAITVRGATVATAVVKRRTLGLDPTGGTQIASFGSTADTAMLATFDDTVDLPRLVSPGEQLIVSGAFIDPVFAVRCRTMPTGRQPLTVAAIDARNYPALFGWSVFSFTGTVSSGATPDTFPLLVAEPGGVPIFIDEIFMHCTTIGQLNSIVVRRSADGVTPANGDAMGASFDPTGAANNERVDVPLYDSSDDVDRPRQLDPSEALFMRVTEGGTNPQDFHVAMRWRTQI